MRKAIDSILWGALGALLVFAIGYGRENAVLVDARDLHAACEEDAGLCHAGFGIAARDLDDSRRGERWANDHWADTLLNLQSCELWTDDPLYFCLEYGECDPTASRSRDPYQHFLDRLEPQARKMVLDRIQSQAAKLGVAEMTTHNEK